jgi:cyd operon protein YbgT
MWYFAWVLGLPLACMFAVLNAMWLELRETDEDTPVSAENTARQSSL